MLYCSVLVLFQNQFIRLGGIIKDGEPMLDLYPGTTVAVKTTKGVYKSESLVLALGPWAATFLPHIGLSLPLQARLLLSFKVKLLEMS